MAMISVENILFYLGRYKPTDEREEIDESLPRKGQDFPWNQHTCLAVLNYIMKLLPHSDHHHHDGTTILTHTITRLDDLAKEHNKLKRSLSIYASEIATTNKRKLELEKEIAEVYVNSFVPEVLRFFKVPKLQQLSNKDKSRKENEILACFLDFLLQILNAEGLIGSEYEQRLAPLQKELRFVLTFLGDVPFQCTQLQQVKNILAELENLSNETGTFIYDCFFATHPIEPVRFHRDVDSLLRLLGLLNQKVKEHCSKFSENPRDDITAQPYAIDSLFIVDSLLDDLENMINRRYDFPIDGIMGQIKTIHEDMMFSRTFLKDVEVAHDTYKDDFYKESSIHIRDVAYEMEYLVNSYIVGNVPIWYLNLRLPNVIQKIKRIAVRLQEIKKIFDDMKVLQVKKDFDRELSFQAIETSVDVAVNDNVVVGFEDEKLKILGALTGSKERQIISIFGMAGLGKTTMAKKLYDHGLCCDHFDKRAWCVVSHTYQKKDVLINIYMSVAASKLDKYMLFQEEDESLAIKIYQSLMGRRYLIVLDDVWDPNMWDDLKTYFPTEANGSRIILTSRIQDIAPTGTIFFPLHHLSNAQCWDLLEKKVFFEESCPPELLGIGKKIAEKCHGLPLAAVVIAGILVKLEKEERVWKKVESNLGSYMLGDSIGCSKILDLSYEYLPNHLKLCFLYLGIYPEDTEFQTKELIQLWIAEGFIPKQEEKSPQNVAEEFLSDLINRSLVMIAKRRFDGGVKTCSVHDLLHEMCLQKIHEENFLKPIKGEFSIYEKHRRLSIRPASNRLRSFGLHCRSFCSFSGHSSDPSPCFSHMPLLRVINMSLGGNEILSASREIYLVVHLRYLCIPDLPHPIIDNLVNLEVLCLYYQKDLMLSSVLKMVKLRHINIRCGSLTIKKDCDTSQTTNLESLSCVSINNQDDGEILRRSPFLRRLKCDSDGALFPDLHSLTQLESLSMCGFECKLTDIYFPSTIKKLTLSNIGLPWEEMSIIGILPNLQCLKLKYNAFVGELWETREGEFQQLRFLEVGCYGLKQWFSSSEHFPKLECLVLDNCDELQEIPNDLGNIPTLHTIGMMDYCSYEATESAFRIRKEQHELGNDELKVLISQPT